MRYTITDKVEGERYLINFKFKMPPLNIKNVLNFRIKSVVYTSGMKADDPIVQDSFHSIGFTREQFNKDAEVEFNFNLNNLRNIRSLTFGFCNEMVMWYNDTFTTIDIKYGQTPVLSYEPPPSNIPECDYSKICMFSTWEIKCGISQYARNFYDALIRKNYEVIVKNNETHPDEIYNTIINNGCGIFIIQFEAAIIKDFEKLVRCVEKLRQISPNIKIYVVIHSDNSNLYRFEGKITGYICHKRTKLNFNRTRCFDIPMGVPLFNPEGDKVYYRNKFGIEQDKFILSTVGFMFSWKQHAVFLGGMVEHLKQNNDLTIQLLTSFHSLNNKQCLAECEKIKSIIRTNRIENQVIHITDYLPQQELNERLFLSDLGFLWSGIETTSSSAALKEFVSSRLPLVKTNSNHLHDVNKGCLTTTKDMKVFINKIIEVYKNRDILNELKTEIEECYIDMNYEKTILQFIEIFNG